MTIVKNPLTLSAAALALFLAGCGGSDDTPSETADMNDNGGGATNPVPNTPASEAVSRDANAAKAAAEAAHKKAADASDEANKNPKVGYAAVLGVSATAVANAQAILDANGEIADALEDAKAALEAAKALPASTASKDRIVKSIEDNIETIEEQQKTVMALAKEITGPSVRNPRTPAYFGTKAAQDLDEELMTFATDDRPAVGPATPLAIALAVSEAADPDDILFGGNTRTSAMKNFNNVVAKGETLSGNQNLAESEQGQSRFGAIGGLAGVFTCVTTECAAVNAGKEIGDGWRFTITDDEDADNGAEALKWYFKDDNGDYQQARYLEWGMWFGGTPATPQSYAGPGAGSLATVETGNTGVIADTTNTATYIGEAAGLATVFGAGSDGEAAKVSRSGHFTADVELKATFSATPTLEGMIDNFQGGVAKTGWKVEIENNDVKGDSGQFTHVFYGESGNRPTGVVGEFGNVFPDGKVAGVYQATR